MISSIIFSKDRPCQLDLLLRSMKKYFMEWKENISTIIYTYSDNISQAGYDIVKKEHPEFDYVCQNDTQLVFKSLVENNINSKKPYLMFFVDDQVFKETFTINSFEFNRFEEDPNIMCLSLRLCPRLNYCYPLDKFTPKPNFLQDRSWYWREAFHDFGYPMSVDSNIYRVKEILPLIQSINYNGPNEFEGVMAGKALSNPKMICYEESKIFNVPVNRVQNCSPNRHGNLSAEFLNLLFLNRKRISLNNLAGIKNISAHQEVNFIFE